MEKRILDVLKAVGEGVSTGGRNMRPPRRLLGGPARPQLPADVPLPGYLCERCQDAPAVQWQPTSEGDEMGVCMACTRRESGAIAEDALARHT